MLFEYQIRNLKNLELALQTTDTITIIGQPKSGRKTVISSLNFKKAYLLVLYHIQISIKTVVIS